MRQPSDDATRPATDDWRRHQPPPRPWLIPGLALIAGVAFSEWLGELNVLWRAACGAIVLTGLVVVLFAAGRESHWARTLTMGVLALAALAVGFARHQAAIDHPAHHLARVAPDNPVLARLRGRVLTAPITVPGEVRNPFLPFKPGPRTRFLLAAQTSTASAPPVALTGQVRVSVETESLPVRPGDRVEVTGTLYRPIGPRNPGERDWARWHRLQGIHAGMSVESDVHVRRLERQANGWRRLLADIRVRARAALFEPFSPAAESGQQTRLLETMVLGQRSAAGRQLNEAFLRCGAMHFLAVSGFHVGVLAGAVWWIVRRWLRRSTPLAAIVTLLAIAAYALLAEPNAPILRAAVMGALVCIALALRRPRAIVNWLVFAAVCILLADPFELFRAGFQLSFLQVAVLITVVPPLYRRLTRGPDGERPREADTYLQLVGLKLARFIVGLALVCACAWLTALPLVLLHFGRFAPWGALQSLLLTPLVIWTVLAGFAVVLAGAVWDPLAAWVGAALSVPTDLLLDAVAKLGRLPGAVIEVQPPGAALVAATYAAGAVFVATFARVAPATATQKQKARPDAPSTLQRNSLRRALRVVSALTLVTCALLYLLVPPPAPRGVDVHVLDVGDGLSAAIVTSDRTALLVDCGTRHNFDAGETATRALRALGVRALNGITVSHANYDHYSGLPTLFETGWDTALLVNPFFDRAAQNSGTARLLVERLPPRVASKPRTVAAGDGIALGGHSLEVLWPPENPEQYPRPNDRSLVLRLLAHGRRLLFPGDIERTGLGGLLVRHRSGEIDLRSDVLVAAHHGDIEGRATDAFLRAVDPELVIVSTGRVRPRFAERVHEVLGGDVEVLSTRSAGAVRVSISSQGDLRTIACVGP